MSNDKVKKKLGNLPIFSVRRSALRWWNKLNKHQQNNLERETYGDGEPWEDNTLNENDIMHINV